MTWRFLNWETDDEIDFPSVADSGPAEILTREGHVISGALRVTSNANELPHIEFSPADGSTFDFFDAIAWRRVLASVT